MAAGRHDLAEPPDDPERIVAVGDEMKDGQQQQRDGLVEVDEPVQVG